VRACHRTTNSRCSTRLCTDGAHSRICQTGNGFETRFSHVSSSKGKHPLILKPEFRLVFVARQWILTENNRYCLDAHDIHFRHCNSATGRRAPDT
jgi:hypothetical protein